MKNKILKKIYLIFLLIFCVFVNSNAEEIKINSTELNILEIGVAEGHGLRALKTYFPNSKIVGVDIVRECKKNEEENIEVIVGSQVDPNILNILKERKFDLIIDDGSHKNEHVFLTFNELFPSLNMEKIGLYS